MDFENFYRIGEGVVHVKDVSHSRTLSRLKKEAGKDTPWKVLQILALRHCFLQLFPLSKESVMNCVNDTLLDFDSVSDYAVRDLIIVESRGSTFCFRLEEILSIFHNDLSRSVLEYEPQYHILTLTKAFRLPTHPYLQEKFSVDEVSQIVQQMVVKFDALPRQFPEVYLYLRHASDIIPRCEKKSNYEVTQVLEAFFESQRSRYLEKYTIKTRENHSHWNTTLPKRVRTERQMYLWFLDTVFP